MTTTTITQAQVPGRDRYVEISRSEESGQYLVALRNNKVTVVSGNSYGNTVLVSSDIPTEELARKIANAMWSHCRDHNDVQLIAQATCALKNA